MPIEVWLSPKRFQKDLQAFPEKLTKPNLHPSLDTTSTEWARNADIDEPKLLNVETVTETQVLRNLAEAALTHTPETERDAKHHLLGVICDEAEVRHCQIIFIRHLRADTSGTEERNEVVLQASQVSIAEKVGRHLAAYISQR